MDGGFGRSLFGLSLCAGAGGLDLGLHIAHAGYRTVGYVEREAYAAATLVARMEDAALDRAPVWDDVASFDGRPWRSLVDIVHGGYTYVHAFCSATFFDDLVSHPEVEESYRRYQESAFLRAGLVRKSFEYAGITFEEYRGKVGSVDFIADGKAHFFPVGVPGLFRQYNAPADFVETANTIGLPRYAKQAVDQEFGRWVKLHTQSNPLPICTRPKVLIKAKRT